MHSADRRRNVLVSVGVAVSVLTIAVIIGSVMVIQRLQDQGVFRDPAPPMTDYAPSTVTGVRDLAYGNGEREKLDVWYPQDLAPGDALPTIVWLHGGGWEAGDKSVIAPYIQILADRGFVTVGVNYSFAPGDRYPTQVRQLNAALGYLQDHAEELHVDSSRFVLAGDSAGAQISAQVAALTVDPGLAADLGVTPALKRQQVSAVLMASGIFDLQDAAKIGGAVGDYVEAYLGTTTDRDSLRRASITNHLTKEFPPTWVTAGNADPLSEQARTFADRLKKLGVRVDAKFYPDHHRPPLIHEYQFDLSSPDSQAAIDSAVRFVQKVTA